MAAKSLPQSVHIRVSRWALEHLDEALGAVLDVMNDQNPVIRLQAADKIIDLACLPVMSTEDDERMLKEQSDADEQALNDLTASIRRSTVVAITREKGH
jgi:hypothetical protein